MSRNLHRRLIRAESEMDAVVTGPDAVRAALQHFDATGEMPPQPKLRAEVVRIRTALFEAGVRINLFDTPVRHDEIAPDIDQGKTL